MIGLLLVTDVRFYREGLAELLGRTPSLRVIATAANGDDAIAAVIREPPDIVLLDTAMPNAIAIAIALALAAVAPHVKVTAR
jgi:YesN/AraC family two-component response regulator